MLLELCKPALIYLIFSFVQVIIDTFNGYFNVAMLKAFTAIIISILFNYLCKQGLGIVSWVIIFIPFILKSVVISILLLTLGLDPRSGRLYKSAIPQQKDVRTKQPKHKKSSKHSKDISKDAHKKLEDHHKQHHKQMQKMMKQQEESKKIRQPIGSQPLDQTMKSKQTSLKHLLNEFAGKEIDITVMT